MVELQIVSNVGYQDLVALTNRRPELFTYDSDKLLDSRGMTPVISPKINRRVKRGHDVDKYKTRHLVENLFQKLRS